MIVVGAVLALTGGVFFLNRDDSELADMSTILNQVRAGSVVSAKMIDHERRVEITTKDSHRYHSYWNNNPDVGPMIAEFLQKADLPGGYTIEVPLN
ncbi:RNA-binding protein [Nonomuraea sp. NBC_01738]|uniref:hypothetical protein n=1 Tax=Nonomuraea sp. NBC_01738 TaxID=2976003 RepID=UPI002E16003C|nr:RNA-binding protein [Nonomuraea sp. NBC_01738]